MVHNRGWLRARHLQHSIIWKIVHPLEEPTWVGCASASSVLFGSAFTGRLSMRVWKCCGVVASARDVVSDVS